MVRLPAGIWAADDDLQSFRALGGARRLGAALFRELAARGRSSGTQMIDATHVKAHPRSASGAKRGEHKQAIGRSRGGRNTKISTQLQMLKAVFFPSF